MTAHNAPDYKITIDGTDISRRIRPVLVSMTVTDNRGFEADTVELTLDDTAGTFSLPRRGALMQVWLGWQGEALVNKGCYIVDEVEHSGAPDQLSIRGKAADLRGSLNHNREHSWHEQTLGDILAEIAGRNGLGLATHPPWAAELIDHMDQQNECDAALLTRMAKDYDAIATVKAGKLLFIPAGKGQSAGGSPLPSITITRTSGDQHRFSVADRSTYSKVIAWWQDNDNAKKEKVEVGEQAENETLKGDESNIKTLRHVYASKSSATRAAKAEWDRLQRAVAQFSITLAKGRPELFPELPATVVGFKPQIDALPWLLTKVTHNLTESGYTNQLELEVKADEVKLKHR